MWQKSKTNVPRSRPVETHKTEVNCDIQLRRYWSQMTGSGHITVFIFLFFPLILTTYEGADGVEACSGIYTRREGTRWTDEGRRACPEDRLAEWIETESDRNRRERANERVYSQRESRKSESRVRESCQEAGYGSKSRQVKSTQPVKTQWERDSKSEYQSAAPL